MENNIYVAWTTLDSETEAEVLAKLLVEEGLASCVQIDGPVRSFYTWKDELQSEREWRLWMKCSEGRIEALAARVREAHPYDLPQWVAVRADRVDPDYARWVQGETTKGEG